MVADATFRVHPPTMDTREPERAQDPTSERLRLARLTASSKSLREVSTAAEAMGVSRQSLSRYEEGKRPVPLDVLKAASRVFGLPLSHFLDGAQFTTPKLQIVQEQKASYTTTRTFQTDAEKISYTIGVLDMANAAKSELSRCLDTAMSALLSPLTAPAPVAPGPSVIEMLEKHAAATRKSAPAKAAPAAGAAKAKGRHSP